MADIAELHRYLRCDIDAERLYWLPRCAGDFQPFFRGPASAQAHRWNSRWAGKEAITAPNSGGYMSGMLLGKPVKAHQIIWAMAHGAWPEGEIDHINGDPGDNRISNLRLVDHLSNARNQKRRATNTSGVMGVHWNRRAGKWAVRVNRDGVRSFLGYFEDFDAAVATKRAAEKAAGYHPNHGRAA